MSEPKTKREATAASRLVRSSALRAATFCGAAAISLTLASTVLADEASEAEAQRAARAHFDRATELTKQGELAAAIPEYEAAFRARRHFLVPLYLAQAYSAVGRPVDALLALELYRELGSADTNKQRRALADRLLEENQPKVGRVTIGPLGPDADVRIDGHPTATEREVLVTVGPHVLTATRPGYRPLVREFDVAAGGSSSLQLVLEPVEPPASSPGAAPRSVSSPPPRPARPSGVQRGFTPVSRTHESSAEFDAAARARSRLWLGTGLSFGASVVSAALGAALGLNAYQAWAERDRHCRPGCDLDAVRAGERAEQSARWSNVAFVVSAASGGGGLLLWSRAAAASRGSSQSSAGVVAVEPMMLSVKGSF